MMILLFLTRENDMLVNIDMQPSSQALPMENSDEFVRPGASFAVFAVVDNSGRKGSSHWCDGVSFVLLG